MKVTVTGTFLDAAGTPQTGTVAMHPLLSAVDDTPQTAFITQSPVMVELDDTGTATLSVEASDDPGWRTSSPVPYVVILRVEGMMGQFLVQVPGPGPHNLADLLVLSEPGVVVPLPPASGATTLDGLNDVDVASATTGSLLQKQPGGTWQGVPFERPLNWLTDVLAPADTPAGTVLGTSGEGTWEPLSLAYLEEQIVGPLQAEIGDPHVVAAHTDLVGFIGEIDQRVAALEVTEVAIEAERHLFVDKYSGSFIRVMVVPPTGPWPAKVDFALATTPGTNGAVYPDLGAMSGGAAVWADFAGTLGRLNMADGTAVYGSTLKEWIRKGSVVTVHRDDTDPAHPVLAVDKVEQPTAAGSSLSLDSLSDVTAPDTTPAGKVLGTTTEGQWGPVDTSALVGPEGPQGPAGPQGQGIRILSAVPDVGSLPPTGNQPGDAHLVTATGNVHIWNGTGWTQIGHVQGPQGPQGLQGPKGDTGAQGPAGPLDILTDVSAPANTPANRLLGTTGTGVWGPVPNPVPSIGPPDAGKVLTVSGTSAVWATPTGGMTQTQADARYLQLSGGTMTGGLNASDVGANTVSIYTSPTAPNHAIPKSYADSTYWHFWSGSQAQYDALATKDAHTLYVILPG